MYTCMSGNVLNILKLILDLEVVIFLRLNINLSFSADFRKASPDEKLNLFNSLLKGYQEEVDNLTKRAKFGENAFLNIYQKLYEAPDPYPSLVSIAVSIW